MLPCLIADSAAFLKNAPLQQMADKIFTIQDVISEIRDATTRHRLAVLPYTIEFREPSTESVKIGMNLTEIRKRRIFLFTFLVDFTGFFFILHQALILNEMNEFMKQKQQSEIGGKLLKMWFSVQKNHQRKDTSILINVSHTRK